MEVARVVEVLDKGWAPVMRIGIKVRIGINGRVGNGDTFQYSRQDGEFRWPTADHSRPLLSTALLFPCTVDEEVQGTTLGHTGSRALSVCFFVY